MTVGEMTPVIWKARCTLLLRILRNFWKMTGICTGHLSREASSFPPMFYLLSHHLQRLVQRLYPSGL